MPGKYKRKDHYYTEAKDQGYRSRAAFKLVEAQKKYKLIRPGMRILDLGCWPGGWLQVASQLTGAEGKVIGVDLVSTEYSSCSNVITLQGDVRSREVLAECVSLAGGAFDLVLSDMAPKLTGIREVDESGTIECAAIAEEACRRCLRKGGAAVIKLFKSSGADEFLKQMRKLFDKVVRAELEASRKTSTEFYMVGTGFKG